VGLIVALLVAVAGGNLAVTTGPVHPRVGHRIIVRSTGQVGDRGELYLYRDTGSGCAASVLDERRRSTARQLATRPIVESFDFELYYTPRRAGRSWVCGYLYALSCDAAGNNCGSAVGLPPDAGFSQVRVKVRPRR
jgi:hypothetical protein